MTSQELAQRDGEVIEVMQPGVPMQPGVSMTLFGTDDPVDFIERASKSAEALARVIESQNLYKQIGKNKHVLVQGWTCLGSMLGVFPVCVWTRKLEDGWEARVEARTRAGEVVGAAEAECLRSESKWKSSDDYAIRSMAQTRATSKALRQPLDFVMTLAGFNATPAEEMPSRGQTEKPKQMTREEAMAEFMERRIKLARLDKAWTREQMLSDVSARIGTVVKEYKDIPDEELGRLLRAARQASSGVEESLGIETPTSDFKAPEGARGSK